MLLGEEPTYAKSVKKSINEIMNPTKILKTEYQELNYAITDGGMNTIVFI